MVDQTKPVIDKKDYECLICLSVPSKPAMHTKCKQVFCVNGLAELRRAGRISNPKCPKCNQEIDAKDQKMDVKLKKEMSEKLVVALCDELVPLMGAEEHATSCKACGALAASSIQAQIIPKEQQKQVVNRSTYTCPLCQ